MEYLKKVFRTIEKFELLENGDKVLVGLSGGKDSAAALFSLVEYKRQKKIECEIKGLHLNFGLPFSSKVEEVVREQASVAGVEIISINLKERGISLEEVLKRTSRPICSACGVVKRYMMNKIARKLGANKLATGHNMDDFLVFFFKNLIGKNFVWIRKFKPKVEPENPKLVCKIRPLFFVSEEENEKFCEENKIPFLKEDVCPHSMMKCKIDLKREKWFNFVKNLEKVQKNLKIQLMSSILELSYLIKKDEEIGECKVCGEASSSEVCSFCKLFGKVEV
jgi:tRNA(Ile)-lysidine synthase TilS/MesJ